MGQLAAGLVEGGIPVTVITDVHPVPRPRGL